MQYLADQHPDAKLAPENATLERARLQEAFNFLTSDVHKSFGPIFGGGSDEEKQHAAQMIEPKFDYINAQLSGKEYLVGDSFTIVDAYLYVLTSWTFPAGMDLNKWSNLAAYFGRISARESVVDAMQLEGLTS